MNLTWHNMENMRMIEQLEEACISIQDGFRKMNEIILQAKAEAEKHEKTVQPETAPNVKITSVNDGNKNHLQCKGFREGIDRSKYIIGVDPFDAKEGIELGPGPPKPLFESMNIEFTDEEGRDKKTKLTYEGNFNKTPDREEFDKAIAREVTGLADRLVEYREEAAADSALQETSKTKTEPTFRIESIEYGGVTYIRHPNLVDHFRDSDFKTRCYFPISEHLLKRGGVIKSVQRLSDGEVFLVGQDYVRFSGPCSYDPYLIDNLFLREDGALLVRNIDNTIAETIETVQKYYKVEDGWVSGEYPIYTLDLDNWHTYLHRDLPGNNPREKYFKSKENAEKYIKENKLIASLKDVDDLIQDLTDVRNVFSHNWPERRANVFDGHMYLIKQWREGLQSKSDRK